VQKYNSKLSGTLLQVFPSILEERDNRLYLDIDWLEAIELYLEYFEKVIFACPISDGNSKDPTNCRAIDDLPKKWAHNLEVVPLPSAHKLPAFWRYFSGTRKKLRHYIKSAQYLEFSPSCLIGDWAGVSCFEAMQLKRPYVISGDVVYHERMEFLLQDKPALKHYVKKGVSIPIFKKYYKQILRNSSLALFQGQDVYNEYSPFCSNSNLIYHATITVEDRISKSQLERQIDYLKLGRPLKVVYAGRATAIKGPLDWVRALGKAIDQGVPIHATWLGDGPLLEEAKKVSQDLGIEAYVDFAGFTGNKESVFKILNGADIFLFCHKSRESPRCLIEAIATGCALIGYEGEYQRGLVKTHGGALFVPIGDWMALGDALIQINADRDRLAKLIYDAHTSGSFFDKENAYRQRIDMVINYYRDLT